MLGFNIFASMILDGTLENITGSMSVAVQAGSLDTRELDNKAVLEAETVIREAKTLLARDGTRLQFWNDQGNRKELVVASDACKNQGGYVCITPEGHPGRVRSFALPEEAHIFIKEIIAARIAVQECCDKSVSRLLLLVDNAAAVFAIRRGWTKNATAMQDIAKLRGTVAEHGCKIQVIFTPGKLNPADEPSRGMMVDMQKIRDCSKLYHCSVIPREIAAEVPTTPREDQWASFDYDPQDADKRRRSTDRVHFVGSLETEWDSWGEVYPR